MTQLEFHPLAGKQSPRERARERVDLGAIVIPATHRSIDPKKVEELAQSMAKLGLLHPIVVYHDGNSDSCAEVVAGGHRR